MALARGDNLVAAVPRLRVRAGTAWEVATVELPPGTWRNAFTGERVEAGPIALARLLARFPVCLLVQDSREEER